MMGLRSVQVAGKAGGGFVEVAVSIDDHAVFQVGALGRDQSVAQVLQHCGYRAAQGVAIPAAPGLMLMIRSPGWRVSMGFWV